MRSLVHIIVGARPNFMKAAPLWHALSAAEWCDLRLVHTGQHYSPEMSDVFLEEFRLPKPHYSLGVGSGSHAEQTAAVMVAYEKIAVAERPDWVVVIGDVNSTLAATLVAKKLNLRVAHLEAGLRSFDRTMPEEINRIVTDALADLLWTPSVDGDENLVREGVSPERIERVGNVMIDAFEMMRLRIEASNPLEKYGIADRKFAVVTLHRPSNVDDPARLLSLVDGILEISKRLLVVMPVHPRTRQRLITAGLIERLSLDRNMRLIEPLAYVDFMALVTRARFVVTDSGGVQEETTYLGIPCLTMRDNTERPITITEGSNLLISDASLVSAVDDVLNGPERKAGSVDLWDGRAAERIAASLHRRSSCNLR